MSIAARGPVAATQTYRGRVTKKYRESKSPMEMQSDRADSALQDPPDGSFVFVGGQNGTWFQQRGFPRLDQVSLQDDSAVQLDPVRSGGTVWGGGCNGSQLLVSGWGSDDGSRGPYVWLYNGAQVVTEGSLDEYGQASSWSGGDVFAASYNGKEWLLTGLGSGPLQDYRNYSSNHMSMGTFNGSVFTDLSNLVPDQQDAILYTTAWNGQYWLVGGGYLENGVLFKFDGNTTVDLTSQLRNSVAQFGSVQSLAWNGEYWLVGGIGFIAEYDGQNFVDLTAQLQRELADNRISSVNAIAWNGQSWLIGGGTPIAQTPPSQAWLASYSSTGFVDLSSTLPLYILNGTDDSGILTITFVDGIWILGGYSGAQGILLGYNEGVSTDYSSLVAGFTYVDWVSSLQVFTF